MSSLFGFLVIFLLSLLIVLLLWQKKEKSEEKQSEQSKKGAVPSAPGPKARPCPLCYTLLVPKETVHSTVYTSSAQDKVMEIWGCPYCFPSHPKGPKSPQVSRICPVCKKEVSPQMPIFARLFPREGKDHIHVLGCPACRKGPRA